jgi:hypothetical protein
MLLHVKLVGSYCSAITPIILNIASFGMVAVDPIGKLLFGGWIYIQKPFVPAIGISTIHLSTGQRFIHFFPLSGNNISQTRSKADNS